MKKKNIIINIIVLLIVTGLTIFYLIKSNLFNEMSSLKDLSIWGLLIILLVVIGYVLADSYIVYHSIKRQNEKAKFKDGLGAYLIGNLGSNITPWKIGHFPSVLYYYNKKKYNLEQTLTIVSENHLVYSTFLSFFYLFVMSISLANNFTVKIGNVDIKLYLVALFGSLSNILYLAAIIILIKSKKIQDWILKIEVYFTKKFKKDKDIEKYIAEKKLKMQVYEKCFDDYKNKFYTFIKPMFAYLIFMLCNYGLPYVIYLCLSHETFDLTKFFEFFLLIQAMRYVSNIIPIPGGTGVTEYAFIQVYQVVMGDYVSLALVIWRILTYFGFIILDFIYFIIFNSRNQIKIIKEIKKDDC